MALVGCGGSSSDKTDTGSVTPPVIVTPPTPKADFIGFESPPVRPIAKTPDSKRLLVANTSNNSLEIFDISNDGSLVHKQSLMVGLEPVSVNVHHNKAWVINHLSDSISLINLDDEVAYIERTLLVGDEPRDIVFANNRAFITTAHRGQHRMSEILKNVEGSGDPKLHSNGQGRADIWVFDAENLGISSGGKPIKIMSLFGDSFRGLAVTPDKKTIYAGVLNSGNQTTAVHESVMCYGYEDDEYGAYPCQVLDELSSPNGLADGYLPGGRTAPGINKDGVPQPWTSMIVKYNNQSNQWEDTKGRNFSNGIRFSLPDLDVFEIDTETLTKKSAFAHVGTTLFNLAVNPKSGNVYVSNTEANNATRFEGAGQFGASTVQGNIAQSRITVIKPQAGSVSARHLNRHINYDDLKGNASVKQHSLSTPTQLAVSQDGKTLYSAVIGSDKVAVIPTQQLDENKFWDKKGEEFNPVIASQQYFTVAGGPAGLLLDELSNSLYVFTRFDNSLVRIDLKDKNETMRLAMPTLEPANFMAGRSMLYDANRSSSNGESSCASCHIFGDTDHLSWNLGNPDASNSKNPQAFPTQNLSELGCTLVGPAAGRDRAFKENNTV